MDLNPNIYCQRHLLAVSQVWVGLRLYYHIFISRTLGNNQRTSPDLQVN